MEQSIPVIRIEPTERVMGVSGAALLPGSLTFFAQGLSQASNSLVGSANLIKKVYFPRLCVPIAAVASGLIDFALAFMVLLGMMLYYGILPGAK